MPCRIVHVVPGLGVGGAERMLLDLVSALAPPQWQHTVYNLQAGGALAPPLLAVGARVLAGNMLPGRPSLTGLRALNKLVRTIQPHILQGWMYAGNLAAMAAAQQTQFDGPIVWSMHSAAPSWPDMGCSRRIVTKLSGWASHHVQALLYVTHSSARAHVLAGYATKHSHVVPGGIDTSHFVPRSRSRRIWRRRLGLPQDTPLVGIIARPHPMKAHHIFLQAAARAITPQDGFCPIHFVIVGEGLEHMPAAWQQYVSPQLASRMHWLGAHDDVAPILQALDICTLSSHQEALPKILLEALACGTLCVATAVGECPALLAGVGWTIAPQDPDALAAAWRQALACSTQARHARRARGRRRICATYSMQQFAHRMQQIYNTLKSVPSGRASKATL